MADYGMSDVAAFITRERGDKGLSLKQEDFQLVVANSIQLPLGGGVGGGRCCIHASRMVPLTTYGIEHVSAWG